MSHTFVRLNPARYDSSRGTHLADLLNIEVGSDELAARRHVDAVHVGEAHRRAGAAQVHLCARHVNFVMSIALQCLSLFRMSLATVFSPMATSMCQGQEAGSAQAWLVCTEQHHKAA